jgi:DNA polymerase-4
VVTFAEDLTEKAEMDAAIIDLARRTRDEVVTQGRTVTRVAVTVRTNTFFTRTKIRKLPTASVDETAIVDAALSVFDQFELDRPVRLLGVRLELAMPPIPVSSAN